MPASLPAAYNRVPRVTVDFWVIKLMAVTVGETAADYLALNLGLGLPLTSAIMTGVLVLALVIQFAQKIPSAVAPLIAGVVITIGAVGHVKNYTLLYFTCAVFALVGGLIILLKVTSVR